MLPSHTKYFTYTTHRTGPRTSRLGRGSHSAARNESGRKEHRSDASQSAAENERGAQRPTIVDRRQTAVRVERSAAGPLEGAYACARREESADARAGEDTKAGRGVAPGEGRDHEGVVQDATRVGELQAAGFAAGE